MDSSTRSPRKRPELCHATQSAAMMTSLLLVLAAGQAALSSAADPVIGFPVVDTTLGKLRGVTEEYDGRKLNAFRGIRYTEPPVNERRFLRAHLINESWSGVRNATAYGAVCIQNPAADPNMQKHPEAPPPNEDCLFVNVFTPIDPVASRSSRHHHSGPRDSGPHHHPAVAVPPGAAGDGDGGDGGDQLLPVLVWIHGGGLCMGSSSEAWGTGWDLVKNQDVVLVNFNYRLGALGYMVSDSSTRGGLPDDEFVGNGGMNGIHDQVVALQWVRREIRNFGGDPDRVTIFGDSAGGYSICTLAVAPPAAGLFKRSIVHSGPCVGGWGPLNVSFGHRVTQQILANHSASTLAELQSAHIDPATIQWPDYTMNDLSVAPYFSAYFFDEGGVVPEYPAALFRNISQRGGAVLNSESFVIGTTSRDGTAQFYGTIPMLPNTNGSLEEIYQQGLEFNWGDKAALVGAQYPLSEYHGSPQEALVAADGDAYVICPSREVARLVSASGVPTHAFQFAHYKSHNCDPAQVYLMLDVNSSHPGWASHGGDVQYIHGTTFGPNWNYTRVDCPYSDVEASLVQDMQTRWINFATNGSVDSSVSGLEWAPYLPQDNTATAVLQFAVPGEVGGTSILRDDRAAQCDFWARVLPSV